ncbi:MAG: hypothetical protein F6J87_28955 [Spirulina sp. SIO3F2]|nr:hypothetical protein [Spirulina sp. SIO3F2]
MSSVSNLLKLAKQGDAQAIATLLGEKLESKGIWVMGQRHGDDLNLIFESLQAPPQASLTQFIAKGMRSLQPVGLRQVVLHGRQMGESADAWQQTLKLNYIAPPQPVADGADEVEAASEPAIAPAANPTEPKPDPGADAPNALVASAQRGEKGEISALLVREFRLQNVVVRTALMGTCLQINFSGPDATDQAKYVQQADQLIRELQLPFVEWLRIQGFARGQTEPLWSVEYDPNDPATAPDYVAEPFKEQVLDTEGQKCLLWGLAWGLGLALLPLTRFVLSYFVILVHELGHAIAYWLFGYPAVPAPNFIHGGGITIAWDHQFSLLLTLIIGGLGYLLYLYRQNVQTQRILAITLLVYFPLAFTPLHKIIISAMGHGGEVITIGLCFYFTLGKHFCIYPGERSLFAMLGWFTFFKVMSFSSQLMFSPSFLQEYRNGIGGMLDNDLVVLADRYHLFGVTPLAAMLLVFAVLTPGLTWLAFRYEKRWVTALTLLLVRDRTQLMELKAFAQSDAATRVMRRSPRSARTIKE